MNKKIIVTKSFPTLADWHYWLNEFSKFVANKEYKKLDYHLWKDISRLPIEKEIIVNLVVGLNYCTSHIEIVNDNIITALNIADFSFGEFLFDKMFNQEERNMLYNVLNGMADAYYSDITAFKADKDDCYGDITASNSGVLSVDKAITSSWTSVSFPTSAEVEKIINDKINELKEKEEMKGFNFDFGPCTNEQIRMSMYGIAVKNAAGTYVSYNPKSGEIVDVDILNFNGGKYMYKIPVAIKDIAVGDIVIHNRTPMFVKALPNESTNTITCVDVSAGEQKHIIPTVSPFGFNFITKVVSFFDMVNNTPTSDAPFGNMLPFMLMGEDNGEIDPMMMMLMMGGKMDMNNPMMMYFMLKDRGNNDMLPFLFMMNK